MKSPSCSMMHIINAPGLDDAERRSLMLDTARATEAQVVIRLNKTMRKMIYGY